VPRVLKLDWYVTRTFLGPFAVCALGFVGLYVVVDFFANIDEFLAHESVGRALRLALVYYALRIPSFLSQIMPVLTVVPAVVCLIRLEHSNELSAMRACGISGRRLTVPLIFCGAAVMALAALNQELLVPRLREPLLIAEQEAREAEEERIYNAQAVDTEERLLLIGTFDLERPLPTLTDVRISWEDEHGLTITKTAPRAFSPRPLGEDWFMESVEQSDGTRGLIFRDRVKTTELGLERFHSTAVARLLEEYNEAPDRAAFALQTAEKKRDRTVLYEFGSYTEDDCPWPVARHVEVIYPLEADQGRRYFERMVWIEERWLVFGGWRIGRIDPDTGRVRQEKLPDGAAFETSIRPADIRAGEFQRISSMMTLAELADRGRRYASVRVRRRCWLIVWNRLAFLLANVILVMLSVPVVFRQTGRSALLGVALAVLVALLYIGANLASLQLGHSQRLIWKYPWVAGTLPTVVFAAVAVWLFLKMDEV
jgi:lipopolysaccharide export LptBFGC system permease protein LptF